MESQPTPTQSTTPTPAPAKGSAKPFKIATCITSVIALAGIGFGVYGMLQSTQKDTEIADLKVQIKNTNGITTTIDTSQINPTDNDGTTITITDTPTASEEDLSHYIYIAQWGIKIKLPSTLGSVSYHYDMMPGYTQLGIAGVDCTGGKCQYAPDFANLSKTDHTLGLVTQFYKGTAPTTGGSLGEKVTTIGDYEYYYAHPQSVYSTDSDEKTWEVDTVNLIKEALTNPDNYSKI